MFLTGKGGVHVPHNKNTAGLPAVRMPAPSCVVLPTSMHIGKPANPVVKPKDHVNVGTLIAESSGPVSSPVYSSISGEVTKIDTILTAGGTFVPAIFIQSDGQMTVDESICPPVVNDYASFIEAVRQSGIVGLGGAGFPTAVKLDVKDTSRIKELVINAAECEPYITSDTRTMLDDADDVKAGIELFEKYLDIKKVIIGIESNKPDAIRRMKAVFANDDAVTVMTLPGIYPQGAEKIIIKNTTGKTVPAGKLPIDVGSLVCNVTTIAAIARYIKTGMPLVEKCVTVDGTAVSDPKNVIVPIGTSVKELISFCNIKEDDIYKILFGGPMMGISTPDPEAPILKNTNAITVMGLKEATQPKATQCIHCGKCATHCPMNLTTFAFGRAYERNDAEELQRLRVDLCVECGCCSFICPAKRPLVEINKLSKAMLRSYQAKQKQIAAEKEAQKAAEAAKEAKKA